MTDWNFCGASDMGEVQSEVVVERKGDTRALGAAGRSVGTVNN